MCKEKQDVFSLAPKHVLDSELAGYLTGRASIRQSCFAERMRRQDMTCNSRSDLRYLNREVPLSD